jgi:hypothetical protein
MKSKIHFKKSDLIGILSILGLPVGLGVMIKGMELKDENIIIVGLIVGILMIILGAMSINGKPLQKGVM